MGWDIVLYTTDVHLAEFVDSGVQVLYIFTDFLSTCFINYCDRDIKIWGHYYANLSTFLVLFSALSVSIAHFTPFLGKALWLSRNVFGFSGVSDLQGCDSGLYPGRMETAGSYREIYSGM